MQSSVSSTRELAHLAWPMLVAQLAMMANAVIDTAMAGRLSAIDLAAVGIAASIMATVLMSLVSVLLALPPIIAHLYGAEKRADVGREIHQGIWISLMLALVAILLLRFPGPFIAISQLQPAVEIKVRAYLTASSWGVPAAFALRLFFGLSMGIGRPRPVWRPRILARCDSEHLAGRRPDGALPRCCFEETLCALGTGVIQARLREEGLSSLLRANHLRSSSRMNMPDAKGMTIHQTFSPMGAVPSREFPQGV